MLGRYLSLRRKLIEKALDRYLPEAGTYPPLIHEAMRYSVFAPAKRIRPIMLIAACEACGGSIPDAMPAACGIELIHTYSLIHDDLPAMDDDDSRRGKPSSHKRFGEATAILAGDALLSLAFEVIASKDSSRRTLMAVREISNAIGSTHLIGGQLVDTVVKFEETDLATIEYVHTNKTGALFAASTKAGAIVGGGTPAQAEALYRYGAYTGFAFQLIDDVIDGDGYAGIFGKEETVKKAAELTKKAKKKLDVFGRRGQKLKDMADLALKRRK